MRIRIYVYKHGESQMRKWGLMLFSFIAQRYLFSRCPTMIGNNYKSPRGDALFSCTPFLSVMITFLMSEGCHSLRKRFIDTHRHEWCKCCFIFVSGWHKKVTGYVAGLWRGRMRHVILLLILFFVIRLFLYNVRNAYLNLWMFDSVVRRHTIKIKTVTSSAFLYSFYF